MWKKNRIATLIVAITLIASSGYAVSAETHSKAYTKRVSQLLRLENIYKNKDGLIGGVFKLEDGTTARIYGVSEKGTVYVNYKGRVMAFSNREIDLYIQRTIGE